MTTVSAKIQQNPTDFSRTWTRIAGYSGIAFVVLFIALGASIAAAAPTFTDGADELRTWFADNQGPIAFFSWFAPFVAGLLQLIFAVGLLRRLSVGDTSGGVVPRISFAGIVAQTGAALVGLSLWALLTLDPILAEASDGLLLAISAMDSIVFFALMPWAMAIFFVFASVLILQTRIMPAWLAGLGVVAGVVPVIGGTWLLSGDPGSAIRDIGFVGELAGMVWVLFASVFLIRSTAD